MQLSSSIVNPTWLSSIIHCRSIAIEAVILRSALSSKYRVINFKFLSTLSSKLIPNLCLKHATLPPTCWTCWQVNVAFSHVIRVPMRRRSLLMIATCVAYVNYCGVYIYINIRSSFCAAKLRAYKNISLDCHKISTIAI